MRSSYLVYSLVLLFVGPAAIAQEKDVPITVEKLAPGVAVLFGQGGNIGLSYGEDGTVLIDDQFAPMTPKIQAAIAGLGGSPVKFLLNTHWHFDHTGGNENFGKAGALIMAHDNVRTRMTQGSTTWKIPPASKVALPVITYHDGLKLHLNGDEVRTLHMHNGHTDGDSIVMWKNANIVHMGDLFFNKVTLPFIDLEAGGNARGMLAAVDRVLGMTDANTKFIPGHGPMASRADLIAYRDMLQSVIQSVRAEIKAKKTLKQIQAMKPAAKWDTNKDAFLKGDAFVEAVYNSLMAKPASKDTTVKTPHGHSH
jgi:cyclase